MSHSPTDVEKRKLRNRDAQRKHRNSMRSQVAALTQMNQKLLSITENFAKTNPNKAYHLRNDAVVSRSLSPITLSRSENGTLGRESARQQCTPSDTSASHQKQDKNEQNDGVLEDVNAMAMEALTNSDYHFDEASDNADMYEMSDDYAAQLPNTKPQLMTNTPSSPFPEYQGRSSFPDFLSTTSHMDLEHNAVMASDPTQYLSATSLTFPSASTNCLDRSNSSALHDAVRSGRMEALQTLIACGMDVNVQDKDGDTPLHCCAIYNNAVMAQTLLDHGCFHHLENGQGFTALALSAHLKHVDVTKLLIQRGVIR